MSKSQSFSLWLLQVLLVSGLLVFFLWLSLRPSDPSYTIVDFTFPATADNTTMTISIGLEASNDNRGGGIFYNDINVTLYSDNNSVGATRLPSFYQGHGKTTQMAGNVAVSRRVWEVGRVAMNGTADLKVGLATTVRHRIWGWRSRVHRMDMEAGVPLGADGKVSGKRKKIKMHRRRKKWRSHSHLSKELYIRD